MRSHSACTENHGLGVLAIAPILDPRFSIPESLHLGAVRTWVTLLVQDIGNTLGGPEAESQHPGRNPARCSLDSFPGGRAVEGPRPPHLLFRLFEASGQHADFIAALGGESEYAIRRRVRH